ncbi:uncharacterized protein LOC113004571 [Solenopsis invicta]|uniref:uncharacterized protein LOC113004571 n=1 Tax=Solenopsis invicta TaxID=13686 RepID=UPI000E33DA9F|nr:uncharacterized protein LOC113004571 [Solenopsis invicta]
MPVSVPVSVRIMSLVFLLVLLLILLVAREHMQKVADDVEHLNNLSLKTTFTLFPNGSYKESTFYYGLEIIKEDQLCVKKILGDENMIYYSLPREIFTVKDQERTLSLIGIGIFCMIVGLFRSFPRSTNTFHG